MKLFYTIGEVSDMLGVNASLLRYWESAFPTLKPHKNSHGTRSYTEEDIALLRRILHLTRDLGFTLEGAREQLNQHDSQHDSQQAVVQSLQKIKAMLLEMKAAVDNKQQEP